MKRILTIAATAAALAMAAACGPNPEPAVPATPAAPITAECMKNAYWQFSRVSDRDSRSFALASCASRDDVRAELRSLNDLPEDPTQCQDMHREMTPENMPKKLSMDYAGLICIR